MADISKTEKFPLHTPALEELRGALQAGLEKNFAEAKVSVVECPDLTKDPFQFPVKGLCGSPRITDVGGVPYLVPVAKKEKEYDMNVISKELELPGAFIIGAGAVASRIVGINAEFMPVILTEAGGKPAVNSSYFSSINPADGKCLLEKYKDKFSNCNFGLMGNLFASEGKPGKVIEVRAKKRTGKHSFSMTLRNTLEEHYPGKTVGMGGTFVIQKGKAKIHIMPREFSACPLNTTEEVDNWLGYFEVSAPLICQSVMVSRDPGLDLRLEHTHCFSHHGEGGHYHEDTTPNDAEYLGYFMPAEFLYRVDRPKETNRIGPKADISKSEKAWLHTPNFAVVKDFSFDTQKKWVDIYKVMEVLAEKKTGDHSLEIALRKTLEGHYPDKSLALEGTVFGQEA